MTRWKKFLIEFFPAPITNRLLSWKRYFFDDVELRMLKRLVNPEMISIDVGANKGVYSYHLSRFSKETIAIEPNPELAKFISRSRIKNLTVHNVGASDYTGKTNLEIPISGKYENNELAKIVKHKLASNSKIFSIDVETIDSLLADSKKNQIGFIKIDVEGHEINVIRGAVKVIAENSPILLIEIEDRHITCDVNDIFSEIKALGYQGYFVKGQDFVEVSNFEKNKMQRISEDGFPLHPYVNNFVFFPNSNDHETGRKSPV